METITESRIIFKPEIHQRIRAELFALKNEPNESMSQESKNRLDYIIKLTGVCIQYDETRPCE